MSNPQTVVIELVRRRLADKATVREVFMFGGLSFMVNDKLVVSAMKNGDLLVRVAGERHTELIARPGASQAEMGAGRSMGPGWISVSHASISADDDVSSWLDIALEHNRKTAARR